MQSIKDYYPTLSAAIKGMIDGLNNAKNAHFEVDMETFGVLYNGICYGDAGFAAIQNIMPKPAIEYRKEGTPNSLSWSFLDTGFDQRELEAFEIAIDEFSSGVVSCLLEFYGISSLNSKCSSPDWNLETDNWQEELPKVAIYLNQLISLGY